MAPRGAAQYTPPNPCAGDVPPPFSYSRGFLPAGNDLLNICPGGCAPMTEAQAMKACEASPACAGFTYTIAPGAGHSGWEDHMQSDQFHYMHHKKFECNYGTGGEVSVASFAEHLLPNVFCRFLPLVLQQRAC